MPISFGRLQVRTTSTIGAADQRLRLVRLGDARPRRSAASLPGVQSSRLTSFLDFGTRSAVRMPFATLSSHLREVLGTELISARRRQPAAGPGTGDAGAEDGCGRNGRPRPLWWRSSGARGHPVSGYRSRVTPSWVLCGAGLQPCQALRGAGLQPCQAPRGAGLQPCQALRGARLPALPGARSAGVSIARPQVRALHERADEGRVPARRPGPA